MVPGTNVANCNIALLSDCIGCNLSHWGESDFCLIANRRAGISIAVVPAMGVKRLEDLDAFKLAVEFKLAVYSLVRRHREAYLDLRWRSQLYEAAADVESDIAEGWRRFRKREICQFFRYALASLEEAKRRLMDGVHRGHYSESSMEPVLVLGRRCGAATMAFMKSLGG